MTPVCFIAQFILLEVHNSFRQRKARFPKLISLVSNVPSTRCSYVKSDLEDSGLTCLQSEQIPWLQLTHPHIVPKAHSLSNILSPPGRTFSRYPTPSFF